ncbi:MAG: signal transduction histidine kinase [Acidimicrobiales bacterium]|jgi:signal transduction histidine kinase
MGILSIVIKITLVITILLDGLLCIVVFNAHKFKLLNTLLLIHLLGISVWAFSVLYLLIHNSVFAAQSTYAAALILSIAKFYFVLSFPENTPPKNILWYVPLVPAIYVLYASFISNTYFLSFTVVNGYYISVENGPLASVYALCVTFFLITPIILLHRKHTRIKYGTLISKQIKYLLYGTSFFFILGLVTNSLLPVFFGIYFFNGIGPSFALVLAGFIVFIISKHHFLDLRLVIQRGLIYIMLLIVIIGFYLSILTIFGMIAHQVAPIVSAAITTIIGIFSVPYIDAFLRKKTDPFFFKNIYRYREAMQELSEILNLNISFDTITTEFSLKLQEILKSSAVTLQLDNKNQSFLLNTENTLSIPITSNIGKIGVLFLGEKRSGDPYTKTDKQLLETLSHQIATALTRAKLHKQVKDYSHRLEKKVRERTLQLEDAQERQRQMIHNISHSLQTPLTIMKSELGYIKSKTTEFEQFEAIETVIDDVSTFIYDLLKLAEFESVTEQPDMKKLNISLLLNEIVEYITIIATEKNIILSHSILPDIYVYGSSRKLKELFLSIISNSMKYMNETGQHKISIGATSINTNVIISISDTGIGIDKNELQQIFRRLYRSPNVKNLRGSGLGLSIAKTIAQAHKGDIAVESILFKGSTFTVTLPKADSETP